MRKAAASTSGGLLAFFAVWGFFFAAGGLTAIVSVLPAVALSRGSAGWLAVPATVEHAQLGDVRRGKSTVRVLTARYRYQHAGTSHTSVRIGVESDREATGRIALAAFALLDEARRTGKPVTVHVDPADPSRALVSRAVHDDAYILFTFGLLFTALGLGVPLGFLVHARRERERRASDRTDGHVIPSATQSHLLSAWIFVVAVAALLLHVSLEAREPGWKLLVALFDAVAIAILFAIAYATMQRRKYGLPLLILTRAPVRPGGTLEAIVRANRAIEATEMTVRLECRRVVREPGNTRLETLHELARTVPVDRNAYRDGAHRVPVTLAIPPDATPASAPEVCWTLSVSAATPGVDFSAVFPDLPVYAD